MPELSTYFQSGGLVDAVLNLGLPAPIDVQVSGSNLERCLCDCCRDRAAECAQLPGVSDVLIPQDIDAPACKLDIDRVRASELGLSEKEVVSNVITALTSNRMIAPSYWVDPRSGNDYLLTVQYPENTVKTLNRSAKHPVARSGPERSDAPRCGRRHLQRSRRPRRSIITSLRRVIDVYVAPQSRGDWEESLRRSTTSSIR